MNLHSNHRSQQEPLPSQLYLAEQVRELDRIAIQEQGIPGLTLMERAGAGAFEVLRQQWPDAKRIGVVCGAGNNAGDGYVVARLGREAGLDVSVFTLSDPRQLKGDALTVANRYLQDGGECLPYAGALGPLDVIVDAVLGTGLQRDVEGNWADALREINDQAAPVLALDIPSGLSSDCGAQMGIAVKADCTVSFIGLKQGCFSGEGPELCGQIQFDDLQVPANVYQQVPSSATRVDWNALNYKLTRRSRNAHKGDFGLALLIGGDHGMSGAIRLAGEAAARSGAGLISVATQSSHAALISSARPELMARGVEHPEQLASMIRRASAIAIGPGLGQGEWARALLQQVLDHAKCPLLLDADALNLLAQEPVTRADWILTPHPGEAARLLGCGNAEVQADRFAAAMRLQKRYGGVAVLKGAGSIICDDSGSLSVCSDGNPGMASGGMGDLLSGIICGLLAQGFSGADAAQLGVSLHARAGDMAAKCGERGLLASDLFAPLRALANPDCVVDR